MLTSKIYTHSPIWLQNILVSLRGYIRYQLRKPRHRLINELEEAAQNQASLDGFNQARLAFILANSCQNIPYYSAQNQCHKDLISLEDFTYIDKQTIRDNIEDFKSIIKSKLTVKGQTSGTSGSPLELTQSFESVVREQYFTQRHLKWAGYKKGDCIAWLRGDMIVPIEQKKPPFWRSSYFEKMKLFSSFHLNPKHLDLYIEELLKFKTDIIQAYPSSITILAKHLDSHNKTYEGKLKSIITSSESLNRDDRALIEKVFKCKVFDWYGLFERVAAIANCEHGNYHVLTDYSYVEFEHIENDRYEIIGTNFNNTYQSLIRYKTGDIVTLDKQAQCPCKRPYPIVKNIEGRTSEYLIGEDGQKIHILNHIPKGVPGLLETQFVQNKAGEVEILVVIDKHAFNQTSETKLIQNTKDKLGHKMNVIINKVPQIARTKNGKFKQAICTVKS